ncbi:MAG: S8 family serine peptidase [Thermoproteota archaeon]
MKKKRGSLKESRFVHQIGGEPTEKHREKVENIRMVLSLAILLLQFVVLLLTAYRLVAYPYATKVDSIVSESVSRGASVDALVVSDANAQVQGEQKTWYFGKTKISEVIITSQAQLQALEQNPLVYSIWSRATFSHPSVSLASVSYNIANDPSRLFHKISDAWTGKGVTVAIIDTGIDYTHPDFYDVNNKSVVKALVSFLFKTQDGRPLLWIPYVNGTMEQLYQYDMSFYSRYQEVPFEDLNGHGTHVAGIIAGQGKVDAKFKGVAPNSRLVVIKAFQKDGSASDTILLDALEYVYTHMVDFKIDILSLSWGAYLKTDGNDPLSVACNSLAELGIFVFASAGNSGNYPTTILAPAIATNVFAVGAWDAYNDKIAPFSSTGDPLSMLDGEQKIKPDFMGAGVMVVSTLSRFASFSPSLVVEQKYVALSGTSMASPMVAGLVADWIEYYEYWYGRKPSRSELLATLEKSGLKKISFFKKDFITGYGIVVAP